MSFPFVVSHNSVEVTKLRNLLDRDDDFVPAAQNMSASLAFEKLLAKFSNITNTHTHYSAMRVTIDCTISEELLVISAIIHNSFLDDTIPCYLPLGNESDENVVLVIDVDDLENPTIKGYVDLTKNPIYNLVKKMDAHFQIDPKDILTDWEPFAAIFA
jgi:hypothetical protein